MIKSMFYIRNFYIRNNRQFVHGVIIILYAGEISALMQQETSFTGV